MAGMTIGVATVLMMVALGNGAQSAIEDQVRAAGMNVIVVTSGNYKMQQQWTNQGEAEEPAAYHPRAQSFRLKTTECRDACCELYLQCIFQAGGNPIQRLERGGPNAAGLGAADTLSLDDAEAVKQLKGVQFVSPGVAENAAVTGEKSTWFTRLHGESSDIPSIRRTWVFTHGRFFTRGEMKKSADAAVIGSIVSDKLFGVSNPVGKDIVVKGSTYHIIGVVTSSSWMVPPAPGDDQFDAIYLPVTSAEFLLKRKSLNTLTISTISTGDVTRVAKAISSLLRTRHHLSAEQPDDFVVSSQARKTLAQGGMRTDVARAIAGNVSNLDKVTLDQLGKTLDRASRTMTVLLTSIAAVSLLVGGVGMMNIMLLSVTDRTREIGIRRAVGAGSKEVMLQFLMEAVTLSISGGSFGILVGIFAAAGITRFLHWSTNVSLLSVIVSFSVSAGIGILFGYYPAREASRVSPMISLRYE
jgi:putative ABC transport system permease protein